MVDAGDDEHGSLGQEAQHAEVDAVGGRAVHPEPPLPEAVDSERPVERQRVAAGALLALGRQDVRVPELGQRLLERGEAGGVDAVIVGKQQRGHRREKWSGRLDLNQRPHDPQSCALPGCATPRPQA